MVNTKRAILVLLLLPLLLLEAYAEDPDHWHKHSGSSMGTLITVEFWHENASEADNLINGVMSEMNRVDQLMSPYIETSELAQINLHAFERDMPLSAELFKLIQLALEHGAWSKGTFDITYASIGSQYDYRKKIKPSSEQIEKDLSLINYSTVSLNTELQTIRFQKSGTKIDLGGIA